MFCDTVYDVSFGTHSISSNVADDEVAPLRRPLELRAASGSNGSNGEVGGEAN